MPVLFFIIIAICICIAIQDFFSRAVFWWMFPILLIAIAGYTKIIYHKFFFVNDILINTALLMFVVSLSGIYYLIRYRLQGLLIFKRSIGLGDIVMIPILIYNFSPLNFVLFTILSLTIALIWFVIIFFIESEKKTIPLAGFWALFLILFFSLSYSNKLNFRNDNWILSWLMNF